MHDLDEIVDIQITLSDVAPSASSGGGGSGTTTTPGVVNIDTTTGVLQTVTTPGVDQGNVQVGA